MTFDEWAEHWETMEKENPFSYVHFDRRLTLRSFISKYIQDNGEIKKDKIISHGFYPFIHYERISRQAKISRRDPALPAGRRNKIVGWKEKKRQIYYAAHIDTCIYRYYGWILNEQYNKWLAAQDLGDVVVAYRTNLHKQTNVHFAKRAYDFIHRNVPCHVIIGDFKDFFDRLDHAYLKERLCSLFGVLSLPSDMYKVFRSLTDFSYIERADLIEVFRKKCPDMRLSDFHRQERVIDLQEFRLICQNKFKLGDQNISLHRHRDDIISKENDWQYGIPQGSPMSGVLANIYMMDIDREVSQFVREKNGFYMRYSDDFMVVLPDDENSDFESDLNTLRNFFHQKNKAETRELVILQPNKTQVYSVISDKIINITGKLLKLDGVHTKKQIDFLGFSYDGKSVSLRNKTIARYYGRLYRKIGTITRRGGYASRYHRADLKNLYQLYSKKGAFNSSRNNQYGRGGNFFSYIWRVNGILSRKNSAGYHVAVGHIWGNHMSKIRERLKKASRE